MSAELLKLLGYNNDAKNFEIIIIRHPQNTPIPENTPILENKISNVGNHETTHVNKHINFIPAGTDSYGKSYTNKVDPNKSHTYGADSYTNKVDPNKSHTYGKDSYTNTQIPISYAPDNINFDFIPFDGADLPFYIDSEPSPNGETTFAENEYTHKMSTRKYIKVKSKEDSSDTTEPYMSVDKFIDDIKKEEDIKQGMKRPRYYEEELTQSINKTPRYYEEELPQPANKKLKYDNFNKRQYCILCKTFTHNIDRCHHVCTFKSCQQVNDIHFKNNCPIVKPCCVCGGYYHIGLSCYYRCKNKHCGHYKKYHNSQDC